MPTRGLRQRIRDLSPGRAPQSALFGRDADLAQVRESLSSGVRLLTVTGPPGVGKTALAQHVVFAARESDELAVFVDVSDARTPQDVAVAVARALGIPADDAGTLDMTWVAQRLCEAAELLLVLDNFEQLAGAAAQIMGPVAAHAPSVAVMVTSRERLRLSDERVHPLAPLDVPSAEETDRARIEATDSVKLLLERRARVGVRDPVVDEELFAIRDLVRTLDGWPLAIELAAARLPIMTARALLERISARFELLSEQAPAQGRGRSLDAAIEWSVSLLDESARHALERATVFEGGFDLSAAETVLGEEGEPASKAIEHLAALHDASLLHATRDAGELRYSLYVSVAEYARAHADGTRVMAAERAHKRSFLERATTWSAALDGPRAAQALASFRREEANLGAIVRRGIEGRDAAALSALVLLDPLRASSGPLDRHVQELDRAIDAASEAEAPLMAAATRARGRARWLRGRADEAERDLRHAVELSSRSPHNAHPDEAALDLGVFLRARGAMDESERWLTRAIELASEPVSRARALSELGILRKERGDLSGARQAYEEALEAFRALGHARGEGRVLCDLGALLQEEGAHQDAARSYAEALTILEPLGDARLEAIARSDAGGLALETASFADADVALSRAVSLLEAVGDRRYAALFTGARAAALAGLGRIDEAEALFARSEMALSRAADRLFLGSVTVHRGHLDLAHAARHRASGEGEQARVCAAAAEARIALASEPGADGGRSLAELSDDVRLGIRALRCALGRAGQPTLMIAPDAVSFVAPDGQSAALDTRPVLQRLLLALVEAHGKGQALEAEELIRAGWPAQRTLNASAKNRLAVALSALRDLGLRPILIRDGGGYRLDPELRVVVVGSS